jgi:cell wall-associated NlpC family hydrolase
MYFNRFAFVVAVMAFYLGWAVPASAEVEGPYYVKGSRVNLREAPSGDILQELSGGEKLFIIEHDGEWCHVSLPVLGTQGWVHQDFVAADAGSPVNTDPSGSTPSSQAQTEGDVAEVPLSQFTEATDVIVGNRCIDPQAVTPPPARPKTVVPVKATKPVKGSKAVSFKAVKLTSPGKLGSAKYKSVAGPELASISGDNVNLRETPSLKAKVLGSVTAGDRAYVITNSDPWYLVSIPDKKLKGWVMGDFVDVQPRIEIKADDVRLRESPSTDARVKDQLSRGDVFYKLKAQDGWVQVASSASGMSGWVKADYTVKSTGSVSRPYTISGDAVNFRASPAIDADVIAKLPAGATVNVLGRSEKWAYAYYQGHKGWLYTEYLSRGEDLPGREVGQVPSLTNRTLSWKQVGGTSIGNRLIERAKAMMGTPYVWGGESDDGVDCSGLIYKLLGDEGAQAKCLPRRASEQMAQLGLAVDKEDLAPGDLVFFHTYKEGASHVGIYLGDGDFIHASSAQHKVAVSNLSERYYRERFVGARRITEEELKQLQ